MSMVRMAAGALVAWSALAAGIVPGDARRGRAVIPDPSGVSSAIA